MTDKRRFGPQPGPQTDFLKTPVDIAIYGGSAGGGKSFALLLDHLRHIHIPGYNGAFFRRTMKDIKNPGSLWDESLSMYSNFGGEPISYKAQWKFKTKDKNHPAKVSMLGLEYEKELENYKGSQIPVISFDELNTFTERMFWYMLSRNRSGSLPIRPYMRATTNPAPGSWLAGLIDWWIGEDGFIIPERSNVIRYMHRYDNETHWGDTAEELKKKFGNPIQGIPAPECTRCSVVCDIRAFKRPKEANPRPPPRWGVHSPLRYTLGSSLWPVSSPNVLLLQHLICSL